eukprot:1208455-Rhodomonas_salina.2
MVLPLPGAGRGAGAGPRPAPALPHPSSTSSRLRLRLGRSHRRLTAKVGRRRATPALQYVVKCPARCSRTTTTG